MSLSHVRPVQFNRMRLAVLAGIFAATSTAHGQITVAKPMPATVAIHVSDHGIKRVPAPIFGSFLEPIGDSINHGIVAEVLTNGSLEAGLWNHTNLESMFRDQPELIQSSNSTGIPLPSQPLNSAAGNRYELHVGNAANSWQSLEIMGLPDQRVGIMQRLYLAVHRERTYKVSLYARHVSGPSELNVLFRDRESGKSLAQARVDATAGKWTKYSATLKLNPGMVRRLQAVDFAIAVEGAERVDVDEISVVPADAIGVLDPDAVAMAKALHVTELRFGGISAPTITGVTESALLTSA